jgi:uncharacterized protein involved in outer membrane biogenesis
MRRAALIALAAAGGLCVLLLIAIAIAVATVDLRTLVDPVLARVKAATGRELVIAGPIDLALSLEPRIVINDVALGNPSWSETKDMLRARRIDARVALLPLLRRRFEVVELTVSDPQIALEVDARGLGNWEFGADARARAKPPVSPAAAAAASLAIGVLTVDNATVTYRPGPGAKMTRIAVERLRVRTRGGDAPVDAEFRGRIDDIAVGFVAELGPLDAVRAGRWPLPLQVKGEVDKKAARVTTKLSVGQDAITLDELDVALGAFKATGRVSMTTGGTRPKVSFDLAARATALSDLPLPVAAPPAPPATAKGAGSRYVFSEARLPLDALRAYDADGQLSIAELQLDERVKLAPLTVRLMLHDGRLDIPRVTFGALGGTVAGSAVVDASRGDASTLALKLDSRNLSAGAILAAAGAPRQTRGGNTTLAVDVKATGASLRAWASTASGVVTAVVGPTTLVHAKGGADNAFEAVLRALDPFREVDPSTELQCAVVRLPLAGGVARVDRSIAAETKQIAVSASGMLDFRNETLDLALRPRVKQGVSLDIPQIAELVRYSGSFRDPRVTIDAVASAAIVAKLGAAMRAGGPGALGSSLLQRSTAGENVCDVALGRKAASPPSREPSPKAPADPLGGLPPEVGKALGKLLGR